jgi:hypothetical protein
MRLNHVIRANVPAPTTNKLRAPDRANAAQLGLKLQPYAALLIPRRRSQRAKRRLHQITTDKRPKLLAMIALNFRS